MRTVARDTALFEWRVVTLGMAGYTDMRHKTIPRLKYDCRTIDLQVHGWWESTAASFYSKSHPESPTQSANSAKECVEPFRGVDQSAGCPSRWHSKEGGSHVIIVRSASRLASGKLLVVAALSGISTISAPSSHASKKVPRKQKVKRWSVG